VREHSQCHRASDRRGVHRAVRLTDALIAPTGIVHGLPVGTPDDDFDQLAHAHPACRVIKV
jgi:predicted nucleic acid-binding protein